MIDFVFDEKTDLYVPKVCWLIVLCAVCAWFGAITRSLGLIHQIYFHFHFSRSPIAYMLFFHAWKSSFPDLLCTRYVLAMDPSKSMEPKFYFFYGRHD